MKDIVIGWVISFVLSNLSQYDSSIDWAAVKADADKAANDWIPAGAAPVVDTAVNDAVTALQELLGDQADIKQLLTDAANQNWQACLTDLETLLTKAASAAGLTPLQEKLLKAVQGMRGE